MDLSGIRPVTGVAEQEPVMRSVAMGLPRAPTPRGMPGKIPGRPPIGIPPLKGGLHGLKPNQTTPHEKPVKKTETWAVSAVEPVPNDFPIERTSRHVKDAEPSEVSSRISKCLQMRSIEAKYDNERAVAKCRNPDFVSFRIRLYGCKQEEGLCVLVEVQRRKGSSQSFARDCRAILEAAEGGDCSTASDSEVICLKCPVSQMACLQGVDVVAPDVAGEEELAAFLLDDPRLDSNMLGMELLKNSTDPRHSAPNVVVLSAEHIVSPGSETVLRDNVFSILQHGSLKPDQRPYTGPEGEEDYNEKMHNLALAAVANALATTKEDGSLKKAVVDQKEWFSRILLPVIFENIGRAQERPHDAFLAAKCLKSVVMSCESATQLAIENGAVMILEDVISSGLDHHLLLREEVREIYSFLMSQCRQYN